MPRKAIKGRSDLLREARASSFEDLRPPEGEQLGGGGRVLEVAMALGTSNRGSWGRAEKAWTEGRAQAAGRWAAPASLFV